MDTVAKEGVWAKGMSRPWLDEDTAVLNYTQASKNEGAEGRAQASDAWGTKVEDEGYLSDPSGEGSIDAREVVHSAGSRRCRWKKLAAERSI
jgi:hypothetical protein